MSHKGNHLYEFGGFSFDAEKKVLLRDGKPAQMTPKTLKLLQVLVENQGQIVEKEKLMAEVWADSFVEDSNLTFTVRQLRKALGDDAREPIYVETIPRRGYRFIAEVREVTNDNDSKRRAANCFSAD
jgi:DNA-binding winged helix-turn-helix (wHTH) protein